MTRASEQVLGVAADTPADAYAALLRREQQIDAVQATLGWRLLSHYGSYKHGFVVPAWRRLRAFTRGLLGRSAEARDDYEDWATFADRFRAVGMAPPESDVVSLVMAVDPLRHTTWEQTIGSVSAQQHPEWELAVAFVGGAVRAATVTAVVADGDARVRIEAEPYATEAAALTALLARVRGPVVAILPADVVLAPDTLRVVVEAFRTSGADVLYSDEDHRRTDGGRHTPRFLPAWSPDLLLSTMYWSRVVFYRREVLAPLLPLREELDGAHGYDLALRVTEAPVTVVHVPRILAHVTSAMRPVTVPSPEATDPQRRALELAIARRGIRATIHRAGAGAYHVRRAIAAPARVSIVIPTRDGFAMLRRCLEAVERTRHDDFEVVIIDNGSRDTATLALLAETRHRVVRAPGPFNFSRLNNTAVRETNGRYLLFLNDDTEPTDPAWLAALEEHAQRPEVGAVGAKLLYADGRIQHAGIATGIGGIAGHPGRFAREAASVVRNVSAVTAACLMTRREVFDEIGGFDEALPVNSNDVDLCLRLRARGYLVVYTPHAVVRHYESQTRGARAVPDDAWLMTRRWRDVLARDPYYSPNLTLSAETGEPDLTKPDGWVCLYEGPMRADDSIELAAGARVGQAFLAVGPDLAAVVVYADVAGEPAERALRLTVREAPQATNALRVVESSLAGRDARERWFCFPPIRESAGRFWYFDVEGLGVHPVTLRRRRVASEVMGPCWEDGAPTFGTLQFRLYGRAPHRCAVS